MSLFPSIFDYIIGWKVEQNIKEKEQKITEKLETWTEK
jgi:hypothetical protein